MGMEQMDIDFQSMFEKIIPRQNKERQIIVAQKSKDRTNAVETVRVEKDRQLEDIERLIKAKFPTADVSVRDLAGDGEHYAAHVVASEFKGKTRVQQHQMVYEALGGRMGGALHALALTTAVKG